MSTDFTNLLKLVVVVAAVFVVGAMSDGPADSHSATTPSTNSGDNHATSPLGSCPVEFVILAG